MVLAEEEIVALKAEIERLTKELEECKAKIVGE